VIRKVPKIENSEKMCMMKKKKNKNIASEMEPMSRWKMFQQGGNPSLSYPASSSVNANKSADVAAVLGEK